MFDKIKSLKNIVSMGLNVHKFYIPNSYEEYIQLIDQLNFCTIRTDHEVIKEDLPFYIVDQSENDVNYIKNIWDIAEKNDYKLIISDGIKYDDIQNYNLVTKIEKNGDFIFEASELKIPLRHMYRHPLLSCYGNVSEEISEWHIINNIYGIDRHSIKRDLETLYTYGIHNRWLEVTKYPQGVGIRNEPIIFWQII
ncbi:MAG TPA: hypothetical protein GXZ90_06250 [Clostridiales bacterium]|nr:hypothetical protein [Clostridiales bacterium]